MRNREGREEERSFDSFISESSLLFFILLLNLLCFFSIPKLNASSLFRLLSWCSWRCYLKMKETSTSSSRRWTHYASRQKQSLIGHKFYRESEGLKSLWLSLKKEWASREEKKWVDEDRNLGVEEKKLRLISFFTFLYMSVWWVSCNSSLPPLLFLSFLCEKLQDRVYNQTSLCFCEKEASFMTTKEEEEGFGRREWSSEVVRHPVAHSVTAALSSTSRLVSQDYQGTGERSPNGYKFSNF